ncbi:zinc-binding alcohol dehydrogenase [Paenibacillus hodogayensis]|uniref:Zinc-binding alcohol dehydrogenase n=1 Tax=Paenibacillus hodogayensis TaxID=279208 RepID=A0ABV5W7E9_9BACL
MKSLDIVFADKQVVEVREQEVPALAPEQIRCAAKKSLISTGTETICLRGVFDPNTNWESWVKYPFYPGYSMSAEVIEVGSEVKGIKPGDSVFVGIEHRQFFNVHYKNVMVLPDGIDHEMSAWTALARIAQVGVRRAELKLGETVGVIGLGILGQLVVQYLRAFGARRIVAIDPASSSRIEAAKRSGATHLLQTDVANALEEVKQITGGKMLDVVFDVTGHPSVLAPATLLVGEMGRVVLLGDTSTPSQQHLGPRVLSNSVAILGIHAKMSSNYNGITANDMNSLYYDYLLQNRMDVNHLITHRHSPLEAPQVYDWLMKDRSSALGVIFDWEKL